MAGFFSLGGGSNTNNHNQDPNEINPDTLFLYTSNPTRNQDNSTTCPYNKGTFELWQNPPPPAPPPDQHQQRQNPLMFQDLYSLAVGSSYRGGGINIFDESKPGVGVEAGGFMMMGSGGSSSSGTISCQDCGNQAKKDCVHRRCRSCCKSRGFECPTHVKSTWVPAAKRRERQQQIAGAALQHQNQQQQLQMNTSSRDHQQQYPKRVREKTSSSLPTSNPSGLESNLPAEVNSLAVFRCVRVSSIDNTEDQFAYQTAVSIGGHTFKGILYDQGPEAQCLEGDTSSGVSGNIPQLNLTTVTSTSSPGTTTASTFLDNYQSAPHNPFMAGTQFFHQPPRS